MCTSAPRIRGSKTYPLNLIDVCLLVHVLVHPLVHMLVHFSEVTGREVCHLQLYEALSWRPWAKYLKYSY